MPRLPRNYQRTSFFHVMSQGINKDYIFKHSEDIKYYIKMMYELKTEYEIKIIAYCIMTNHTHILLQVKNLENMSKYMQRLNLKYGRYYNIKYNRVGYVFRDRYRAEGIYSEEQLICCINYIYNNPVKAGICKSPEQYPYSNYHKLKKSSFENYSFIDIEEDEKLSCNTIIKRILNTNNLGLLEVKKNKEMLKKLIIILKEEYGISLREISKELQIGRETLRKLYLKAKVVSGDGSD